MIPTSHRVLRQLRHDPRTLALLLLVPCVLVGLLAWVYADRPALFDAIGAPLLGIFPFITMFLVTSVVTLRERTTGTLERLLTLPVSKADIIGGYAVAFGLLAAVQGALVGSLALGAFGLDVAGPAWAVLLVAVVDALLGTALGLFVSAFAATEFQAVQFLPALVLPQFLLCGLLVPRDRLPGVLRAVSDVLPLSYAVDAMHSITTSTEVTSGFAGDLAVVAGFAAVALALGAATLRRRTP